MSPRPAEEPDRRRNRIDALLAAAGRGDLAAFGDFYDHTAPTVFAALTGLLGHPGRAERATEHLYGQLWRVAPEFDPDVCSACDTVLSLVRRGFRTRADQLGRTS